MNPTAPLAALVPACTPRRRAAVVPPLPTLTRRRAAAAFGDDTGAATAEYAVATMAKV